MADPSLLAALPAAAFAKEDRGPDPRFYAAPRFVTHIDEGAIAAVTDAYRSLLPAGGRILDLMSSWVSHLPPEVAYAEVLGHGLNAAELARNPRLDSWWVQDLNAEPVLPLPDAGPEAGLDAAAICVSVQYLQRPVEVLREVRRALRPGSPLVVSFSNRCFPTKAVAVWRALDGNGHRALVSAYLRDAGFAEVEARAALPERGPGDPLSLVTGRA